MKDTKRRLEIFSFFGYDSISSHLEKMASKGWMIEKIDNLGWIYHRVEPMNVHFTVTYYPKASEYDPEPSEEQKTFHDFCEYTGWKLACTWAQSQIFYNERENPLPIETEPELEFQAIHASAKKNFIPAYSLLLAISLLNLYLRIGNLLAGLNGNDDLGTIIAGSMYMILWSYSAVELIGYFRWYLKAKKMVQQGEWPDSMSTSKFQKVLVTVALVAFAFWIFDFIITGDTLQRWIGILMCIYMPTLLMIVNGAKAFMKRKKVSTGVNRTVTILLSFILSFGILGFITHVTIKMMSQGFFK